MGPGSFWLKVREVFDECGLKILDGDEGLMSYFAPISSNVAPKFQVDFLSLSASFTGAKLEIPEIFSHLLQVSSGIFFIPNSGPFHVGFIAQSGIFLS